MKALRPRSLAAESSWPALFAVQDTGRSILAGPLLQGNQGLALAFGLQLLLDSFFVGPPRTCKWFSSQKIQGFLHGPAARNNY